MQEKDELSLQAAKLYYDAGLSQAAVAEQMGVSRPTVAKLIQHAKNRGYVVIEVRDPREHGDALIAQLIDTFGEAGLSHVRIAHTNHSTDPLDELGRIGAMVLEEQVKDDLKVGVSWGNTMYAVAKALRATPHYGVEIVQLKGGLSYTKRSTNDIETINLFCRAFNAYARTLPLPVIFDNVAVKETVENDRHIAHILEEGRTTDIVIFTVGAITADSLLLSLGYLSEAEEAAIRSTAVGDACSRFFTETGDIAVPSIDERTVGITLDELKQRPVRILVAGGTYKTKAIKTALQMGLATHLVIDNLTAAKILEL